VRRQWDMAMNYWLPDNRVLKIDLQRQDKETGKKSGWLLCRSGWQLQDRRCGGL